ncbi:MAG: ankyrin repeat domain-containing protein [Gammaproteobacteria bacterium]|nr:ankyrin repeat domain-containing protein [Gammaproteobacteria bacterium]MDD9896986.1 ankyrin repeat domain-containing protein [Gammaproteobacteria bacterium]MDD9958424.1 ankyrin repeat domain-containing protein [Gammaproteobacteria bacterium]
MQNNKKLRILAFYLAFSLGLGFYSQSSIAQTDLSLIAAARAEDLSQVRTILNSGADVNQTQGDGASALHWAAHRNNLELASLLIEAGANINAANELGATALWLAAINGSPGMLQLLLEAGADADVSLTMGETPLMSAARTGNMESVALLLQHGAEINAAEEERGQTALMWAVAQSHADVVQLLIANGADLNLRTKVWYQLENTAGNTNPTGNFRMAHGGSSAIMFAARIGDIATARGLIEAGADVNETAASGVSALTQAAHSGHEELALFLLEQGADPNAMEAGYTALHAAVLRSQVRLVRALLEAGAEYDTPVAHGTPGRRFSADYSIRSQLIGRDAFWMAAKYGEVEILRILLGEGADPFATDDNSVTTLQVAMGNSGSSLDWRRDRIGNEERDLEDEERRTLELAQILIDEGVDVNAVDTRGRAAIHHAVLKDFPTVVEYLAMRGADIHLQSGRGLTPLQLAETTQGIPGTNGLRGTRPEVAAVLRRLGASD